MKGLTRDEYKQKLADILKHERNLEPKNKKLAPKQKVRQSTRKYGKYDKVTTQSSTKPRGIKKLLHKC